MSEKLYVLYDERACGAQGTDDAVVLCTAYSIKEAEDDATMFGVTACYSYDVDEEGRTVLNEQWEFDTDLNGARI